jgi:SAM-dependent methyltransferase
MSTQPRISAPLKQFFANLKPRPSEDEFLAQKGHRQFVGGRWHELGQLQFDFLVQHGLLPAHVFLDIACGSLRAGRLLIPYLEPGHYLGIDKHAELIEAGKVSELALGILEAKRPEFVVSDCFAFEGFTRIPDFAIAQSLFTHLAKRDIELCFRQLSQFARPGCRFFASFFETRFPIPQLSSSHSNRPFSYTRRTMEALGREAGWGANYLGKWNHPLDSRMIEYVKR